jgi:hypothetical protein
MNEDWKWYDNGAKFSLAVLGVGCVVAAMICCITFPSMFMEYKVKMRALQVIEKAVDKGIELRLNGDLLKGIELVKIENKEK